MVSAPRFPHDAVAPGAPRNPLELSAAFLFAVLFTAMIVATKLVASSFGSGGLLALAALMPESRTSIPSFLGVVQGVGSHIALALAACAIVVAAASNNLVKGIYGMSFSNPATGRQTFALLSILALSGPTRHSSRLH